MSRLQNGIGRLRTKQKMQRVLESLSKCDQIKQLKTESKQSIQKNYASIINFKFNLLIDSNSTYLPKQNENNKKKFSKYPIRPHTTERQDNVTSLCIKSFQLLHSDTQMSSSKTTIAHSQTKQKINKKYLPLEMIGTVKKLKQIGEQMKQKHETYYTKGIFQQSRFRIISSAELKAKPSSLTKKQAKKYNSSIIESIRKPALKKNHFVFGLNDSAGGAESKIETYRDYLWKIGFSNHFCVVTPNSFDGYRVYVGKGNNSCMVRGIIKRRSWWIIVEKQSEAHFIWTQLKVNSFFQQQNSNSTIALKINEIYQQIAPNDFKCPKSTISEEACSNYAKIFNELDLNIWMNHQKKHIKTQEKISQLTYVKRMGLLQKKMIDKIDPVKCKMQNHLIQNYYIGNKKALFYNLRRYYEFKQENVFNIIPLTYHICKGIDDPSYAQFLQTYQQIQNSKLQNKDVKNIWIMKPGENSNRGTGISICFSLDTIRLRLKGKQRNNDGSLRTFILQKYLEKPLLYKNRKFDLRHYMLITCINGSFKAYWYEEGYVRTSSSLFTLKNSKDLYIHLTNDAVQKYANDYGKYENGNKLSYDQLQQYISKFSKKTLNSVSFRRDILPIMKFIGTQAVRSTYHILDPTRKNHNFQLLGLDFMIDQDYRPYLIEVNTNPCLELSCPLLARLIPQVIENTIRICVDPIFPPPELLQNGKRGFFSSQNPLNQNKFQLIFDEAISGSTLRDLYLDRQKINKQMGQIQVEQAEFQDDGDGWTQEKDKQ